MSIIDTSDIRSNSSDQVAYVAKVIGRSIDRKKVFEAIHTGKKRIKTVEEIVSLTGLKRKRVLEEAKILENKKVIEQIKRGAKGIKDTAYIKNSFYYSNKRLILNLAGNNQKLKEFPTKINPTVKKNGETLIYISVPQKIFYKQITIDDIDSFEKVRNATPQRLANKLYERVFKNVVKKIINEKGEFKDWGGEKNDLYTTRVILKEKRISTAIAFKGKGTQGKLIPKKMGKNGDQILRLFESPAQLFIVIYQGQIDQSITAQMEAQAISKALGGNEIYFCTVDENDIERLYSAYKKFFNE